MLCSTSTADWRLSGYGKVEFRHRNLLFIFWNLSFERLRSSLSAFIRAIRGCNSSGQSLLSMELPSIVSIVLSAPKRVSCSECIESKIKASREDGSPAEPHHSGSVRRLLTSLIECPEQTLQTKPGTVKLRPGSTNGVTIDRGSNKSG